MKLGQVLHGVGLESRLPHELENVEVRGLAYDSRKATNGYLFFAFAGAKMDGARFANAAIAKGALAVVSDRPDPGGIAGPWLQVSHGRRALAIAAGNFYNHPDQRLALTAVTGTNGKTTSTSLIDAMLRSSGKTTALIGTIEYHLAGRVLPAVNTTPNRSTCSPCFTTWKRRAVHTSRWRPRRMHWTWAASMGCSFTPWPSRTSRATIWTTTTRWKPISPRSKCCSVRRALLPRALRW